MSVRLRRGRILVGISGLAALGFLILRDATVRSSLQDGETVRAATVWSGNPAAAIALGMASIGDAARHGRQVNENLTRPVIEAVRVAPLATEPFLVRGVELQNARNYDAAERLFRAAADRDPRDPAPHLLLSAQYGKIGKIGLSLTEMGKAIRLVPGSAGQIAPQVAAAVTKAGGEAMIRSLVVESPGLRDDITLALAANPANLNFILSLVGPNASTEWKPVMMQSLMAAGLYARAYALWAQLNHLPLYPRPLLIDPNVKGTLPPPFGWTLLAGSDGLAESTNGGGVHLVSFGRRAVALASEILLLPPGQFSLSFHWHATEGTASGFSWQVSCLPSGRNIAMLSFGSPNSSLPSNFSIPADCTAQRLSLVSAVADVPETVDLTVRAIQLRHLR